MSLDKTLEDALRELFSRIEVNVRLEDSHPMVEGTTVMTAPGQSFTLRGDAYRLLQHIADTIAESASLKGGLSLKEAEALVLLACTQFLDQGETVALVGLDSKFQAAPHRWTVIRPAPVFHQAKEVAIGPCRFQRGLPPLPIPAEPFIKQRFPAFTVAVDVEARGPEGAMLIAELRIAEALSVAQLSDRRGMHGVTGATLLVDQDGALRFHGDGSSGAWLDHLLWNRSTGKLLPFFEPLSDALTKPAGSRTEWERRTLAAARWLAKALSSPWPSDSLISQMVALEAVFVPSSWRTKGKKIAEEVSARWVLPAKSRKEQEDWLVNLYRRRNETAHEGGSFEDEIEIDRLGDLTWKTVVWAASHLAPHHRVEWKPCETQAEAMGHDPI